MQYTPMDSAATIKDPYVIQKVKSASPEQLIVYVYDVAIKACLQKNQSLALEAVQELVNALNYEHKELAHTFYTTYEIIQSEIRQQNLSAASIHLKDLRETWKKAFKLG
ncbi:MAG: flagellar protein FliS [FCB group bacterium]|nr:flagellar protein FliS [FCB group bacterium]